MYRRQTGPRRPIARVQVDGASKHGPAPFQVRMVHARKVLTPPQVVLVRLGRRLKASQRGSLTLAQVPGAKGSDQGFGDLVLYREHVVECPVETLRPAVISVGDFHELNRDAKTVIRLANAALQQRGNPELSSGGADVDAGAAELERSAARSDANAVHVGQGIDDLFRHAVTQIVLVTSRAHVREGEDGNRSQVMTR